MTGTYSTQGLGDEAQRMTPQGDCEIGMLAEKLGAQVCSHSRSGRVWPGTYLRPHLASFPWCHSVNTGCYVLLKLSPSTPVPGLDPEADERVPAPSVAGWHPSCLPSCVDCAVELRKPWALGSPVVSSISWSGWGPLTGPQVTDL